MTKTPLQTLIAKLEQMRQDYYPPDDGFQGAKRKAIAQCIAEAEELLPTEKKFAEECFKAGIRRDMTIKGSPFNHPDFPTFFSQYETSNDKH